MNHHLQQRRIYCFWWQRGGRVVRGQRAKLWHWLDGCFEANASGLTVRDQGICLCREQLGIIESTTRTKPSLRLGGKGSLPRPAQGRGGVFSTRLCRPGRLRCTGDMSHRSLRTISF